MNERLHIYAQQMWHDEAYIVGERDALESLRDAITRALVNNSARMCAYCNDGEGYDIHVLCVDEEKAGILPAPYTDDIAKDSAGFSLDLLIDVE